MNKKTNLKSTILSLIITAILGFGYFYTTLPALNFQDGNFYSFIFTLCIIYVVTILLVSGTKIDQDLGVMEFLSFIRKQCLPIGLLMIAIILVGIIGSLASATFFHAPAYQTLLNVQTGDFSEHVDQVSFNEIPTLDRTSAEFLGDRQMGTLSDMVSQFEYSNDSTQINYQGRPVRVAPLAYADLIKWFTNRAEGLPAYVVVDMVTQEATTIRLEEGIKYSFSEPLNRNIDRHLRFQYPTFMFSTPEFEIDENGQPWWIAPRVVKPLVCSVAQTSRAQFW